MNRTLRQHKRSRIARVKGKHMHALAPRCFFPMQRAATCRAFTGSRSRMLPRLEFG